MSYKKIVAGVATFAVAAAMVVPSAFAYTSDQYNEWAKLVDGANKTALTDAAAKADAVTAKELALKSAKAAVEANKAEIKKQEDAIKAAEDAKKAVKADDPAKAEKDALYDKQKQNAEAAKTAAEGKTADLEKAVKEAEKAVEEAKEAFEKSEKAAAGAVEAAKTVAAVAPADKVANELVEKTLAEADKLNVKINAINLTSLEKTYEQQVRTLQEGKKQLVAAMKALDGYKKMAPNTKTALAKELQAVMDRLNKALGQIKDADLEKATDKSKLAKKGNGKKLPKTGEQTPVAPFAAAGAAALIAAGLVASRKVNA